MFVNQNIIPTFAPQILKQEFYNCSFNLKCLELKKLKDFFIAYKGLSIGVHKYDFDINDKFFEEIEYSEFSKGSLIVGLSLEKQERMIILHFSIKGNVVVQCDRCLEEMDYPVDVEETLYVKFGDNKDEETDEILILPETEYQLDISRLINEYITLAMPIRHVHGDDENGVSLCNVEALKMLEKLSERHTTDPRWEKLKNIKLD